MANPQTEGRMLRRSIADSKDFASLSPEAAVLFCMIIPHLNAHGKLQGGKAFIKEIVCPKVQYITIENIPSLLKEITQKTDMKWFCNDDRFWIHAIHFADHQKFEKNKIGADKLPSYSPEKVDDYSPTTKKIVDHEVKDKVEVKVEVKKDADASPFEIPSPEIINESSETQIEKYIQETAIKLYEEKIFPEVHAFRNTYLKKQKNKRSILHTLTRCYLAKPKDPWGYCSKIIGIEDGKYNERDYIKTAK